MTGGRATALLAALTVLGTSGCGSDVAYERAAHRRVEVVLDEYRVTPERISVRAGRVTIVARDRGHLTHNLQVVAFRRPRSGEEVRRFGASIKTLFPGQSGTTTLSLGPGKYRLICTLANHDNLGQWAELKVVR
jgi:uncharacterized cupredoxin-like copper-binding protein